MLAASETPAEKRRAKQNCIISTEEQAPRKKEYKKQEATRAVSKKHVTEETRKCGKNEGSGGKQLLDTLKEFAFVELFGKDNAEKLGDSGKEEISLKRHGTERFRLIECKGILQQEDGAFDHDAVTVKIVPVLRVPLNAGTGAESLRVIRICIGIFPGLRGRAGMLAGADTLCGAGDPLRFGTDPLDPFGTVPAAGSAEADKRSSVGGTAGDAVCSFV